jgi:hypothetical protein
VAVFYLIGGEIVVTSPGTKPSYPAKDLLYPSNETTLK